MGKIAQGPVRRRNDVTVPQQKDDVSKIRSSQNSVAGGSITVKTDEHPELPLTLRD